MNKLKRYLLLALAVLLTVTGAYADSAKQVDFLLSGYSDPVTHKVLAGGEVWTYLDGTSTLAPVWTDRDKGGVSTNPVVLDPDGKAEIYGDGIYKFRIYDSDGIFIQEINGLEYQGVLLQPFNVDSISDLRLSSGVFEGQSVQPLGYYSIGDGGGGPIRIWSAGNPPGTYIDNGCSIIVPTGGDGSGAWIWEHSGPANISWAGGVNDGDVTVPYFSLHRSGSPIIIQDGLYTITVSSSDLDSFADSMMSLTAYGSLSATIGAGLSPRLSPFVIDVRGANKVTISGQPISQKSIGSLFSFTGISKNYSMALNLSDVSGAVVGDFCTVRAEDGTGPYTVASGAWEIISVDQVNNRITLRNTAVKEPIETFTITSGIVKFFPTQLKFDGCDGIVPKGGECLESFDNIIILGDYDILSGLGTINTHGLLMASPTLAGGSDSNAVFDTAPNFAIGENTAFAKFGEQGIVVSSRASLVSNSVMVSSCRKRGIYAEGGHIRCKFAVASGNGEDGIISDLTGTIQAALSQSSGNGFNGYWSTNNSFMNASRSKSHSNNTNGFEARGLTRLACDISESKYNSGMGYSASDAGMIDSDGSLSDSNEGDGFNSTGGAVIDCNTARSDNNNESGFEASNGGIILAKDTTTTGNNTSYRSFNNGIILDPSDTIFPGSFKFGTTQVFDSTLAHFTNISTTSIGDSKIGVDGTNTGVTLRLDGSVYPNKDNVPFGRLNNAFSGVWFKDTGDGQYKKITIENGVVTVVP